MSKGILSFSHTSSSIFHEPEKGFKMVNSGKMFPHMLSAMGSFFEKKMGIWSHMSACHARCLVESLVSLALYHSMYDRKR